MIKLIVTDLDGTLLDNSKNLPSDFFEVLEELNKKDIIFTAASGRSQYTIKEIFSPHSDEIYYISDNGTYTAGRDIEAVDYALTRTQSLDVAQKCLDIGNLSIVMCAKKKAYFLNVPPEHIDIIREYYINFDIIYSPQQAEDEILKVAVYDVQGSANHGYPKIKDILPDELTAVVSSDNWFDVMNKHVNKGVAVKNLQKHFGISEEETMAFGDFDNDIEMLKKAKYSFAMENATDNVKKVANFVAPNNDSFGVIQMIKKFILN